MKGLKHGLVSTDGLTTAEITALSDMVAGEQVFDTTVGVWTWYTGSMWLREEWRDYAGADVDFTVTVGGASAITEHLSKATPYVTPQGTKRIKVSLTIAYTVATVASTFDINGIIYAGSAFQHVSASEIGDAINHPTVSRAEAASSTIKVYMSAASGSWHITLFTDAEITSWPSWAEPLP